MAASDPTPAAAPADGAVAAIRARGRLIVGVDQSTNLMSFRDPMTGTLSGFDVDIAREIAQDLLGDPSLIEFRLLTSAARLDALENNVVDIVARTFTITCARADESRSPPCTSGPSNDCWCAPAPQQGLSRTRRTSGSVLSSIPPRSMPCSGWCRLRRSSPSGTSTIASSFSNSAKPTPRAPMTSSWRGMAVQDPHLEVTGPELQLDQYGIGVNKDHDESSPVPGSSSASTNLPADHPMNAKRCTHVGREG